MNNKKFFLVSSTKISEKEIKLNNNDPLQIAITSIFENRIPVFLPVRQVTHLKIKKELDEKGAVFFETEYGLLEIRGALLTQAHKNLLEAILSYDKFQTKDDAFYVKFSPYDLLKNKLGKENPNDYFHLVKMIKELATFTMILHVTDKIEIGFRFIDDFIVDNRSEDKTKGRKNKNFYYIKFTRVLSAIWENETLYNYTPMISVFDKVKSPIVQALIKFLLTYQRYEIALDEIIKIFKLKKIFSNKKSINKVLKEIENSFENSEILFLYKYLGIYFIKEKKIIGINRKQKLIVDNLLWEIKRQQSFIEKLKQKHKNYKNRQPTLF